MILGIERDSSSRRHRPAPTPARRLRGAAADCNNNRDSSGGVCSCQTIVAEQTLFQTCRLTAVLTDTIINPSAAAWTSRGLTNPCLDRPPLHPGYPRFLIQVRSGQIWGSPSVASMGGWMRRCASCADLQVQGWRVGEFVPGDQLENKSGLFVLASYMALVTTFARVYTATRVSRVPSLPRDVSYHFCTWC